MADTKITWHGPMAKAAIRRGAARGVLKAAQLVGEASQDVVPREDDDLARSMTVTSDDLVAAVAYDTPYAVKQHENLRLRHDRGETGKYLERPLNKSRRQAAETIAAEIRKETR